MSRRKQIDPRNFTDVKKKGDHNNVKQPDETNLFMVIDSQLLLENFKEITNKNFPKKTITQNEKHYLTSLYRDNAELKKLKNTTGQNYSEVTLNIGVSLDYLGYEEDAQEFYTKSMYAKLSLEKLSPAEQKQEMTATTSAENMQEKGAKWQLQNPIKIGDTVVKPQSESHYISVRNLEEKIADYTKKQAMGR